MTGVIVGLVAVVLVVVTIVTIGIRSLNRRESNLPPERVKAMAEGKELGPKRHRPAEDTFFATFPKDFDTFEEPERTSLRERMAKPVAAVRGRRGVDEWGDSDDYDDEYWSRVRADEGGFGGSLSPKQPAAEPETPAASAAQQPAQQQPADPGVAGGQSSSARAGLAGLVENTRQTPAPEQKTVAFAAPTPDVLDSPPATGQPSGSFAATPPGAPAAYPSAVRADDPLATGPRSLSSQPLGADRPDVGQAGGPTRSYRSPLDTTGPFTSPAAVDPLTSGPVRVDPLNTGPVPAGPLTTGPVSADPLTTGPVSHGSFPPTPVAGGDALAGPRSDSGRSAFPPTPAPAWHGAADVLDDPPAPSAASPTTWRADDPYKLPSHDIGYPAPGGSGYGGPSGPSSYEVRTGWAVPEDTAAPGAGASASGGASYGGYDASAGADILSSGGYYREPTAGPASPAAWPEQTGTWPAYREVPAPEKSTGAPRRGYRGGHRLPESDRDSYR